MKTSLLHTDHLFIVPTFPHFSQYFFVVEQLQMCVPNNKMEKNLLIHDKKNKIIKKKPPPDFMQNFHWISSSKHHKQKHLCALGVSECSIAFCCTNDPRNEESFNRKTLTVALLLSDILDGYKPHFRCDYSQNERASWAKLNPIKCSTGWKHSKFCMKFCLDAATGASVKLGHQVVTYPIETGLFVSD